MDKNLEKVSFVTCENYVQFLNNFTGFEPFEQFSLNDFLKAVLSPNDTVDFDLRGQLEEDASRKQLVSYILLTTSDQKYILGYKRLSGSGEVRLLDKMSVGVGGHMNDCLATTNQELLNWLHKEATRELEEEVQWHDLSSDNMQLIGLINAELTPVDKVHLGVVFQYQLSLEQLQQLKSNEVDTLELVVLPLESDILQQYTFENWSRLILEKII